MGIQAKFWIAFAPRLHLLPTPSMAVETRLSRASRSFIFSLSPRKALICKPSTQVRRQETFLIFHLHLFVSNYHSSQPKPRAARKHNTLNFSLVSPLHVHRANVVVFTSRALESTARLKSTGCSGATIGIASWAKCYEANRGWVTCVEAWLCSELFIPWKSYVCLSRCTIPAMSSPNSLMRQNVCPYLKQGRTLNDLLMRAARWMTDLL